MGNIPPADKPIIKHMIKFHLNAGMVPQMPVLMNISAANKIEPRRPSRSARMPQRTEPMVVPISANSPSNDAVGLSMTYSWRIPGTTNPSVAGFMMSTTSAAPSTITSRQCCQLSLALSKVCNW